MKPTNTKLFYCLSGSSVQCFGKNRDGKDTLGIYFPRKLVSELALKPGYRVGGVLYLVYGDSSGRPNLLDLTDKERSWFDKYIGYVKLKNEGMVKFMETQGIGMFGNVRVSELKDLIKEVNK